MLAVPGALAGVKGLALAGLVVYTAAWVWSFEGFLVTAIDVARDPRGRVTYPGLAVFASLLWLIGTLVWYCARLAVSSPEIPTLALLLGFAAQVLLGAMSYLIPTTMGGGPEAVRAGWARFAVFNAALAGRLIASGSWARIVFSLPAFGALVAFLPLMARAAKIQVAAAELQVVLLGVRVLEVDHQLAAAGDGHGVGGVAHVLDVHVHLQHALAAGERARVAAPAERHGDDRPREPVRARA